METNPPPSNSTQHGSLRRRALSGSLLTAFGEGGSQALRVVSNLALTRLLIPEAFGLMAIVNMVLLGLQLFSNVGIQPAVVRHERGDDRDFLDTAWIMQIARGGVLWVLSASAAYPLADFYGAPELSALIPVAAIVTIFDGFASTKLLTLTRHLRPGRLIAIEVSSSVLAIAAMVVLAMIYHSVWALVAGGLVTSGVRTLLSHVSIPGTRNRFQWNPQAAREILSFGKWIFASTLFSYVAMRVDVILLGRLVTLDTLGVYSIGMMIPAVLSRFTNRLIQLVLMPALSTSHRAAEGRLAASFAGSRRIILSGGLALFLSAGFAAPAFFIYLYDARYHAASWVAQLGLLRLWFSFLHESAGRGLLAIGDSRGFALSNFVRMLAVTLGSLAGFRGGELPGLMLGAAAGALVGHLAVLMSLARHRLRTAGTDATYTLLCITVGLIGGAGPHFVADRPGMPSVPVLTLIAGVLTAIPLGLWLALRLRADLLGVGESNPQRPTDPANGSPSRQP